MQIRLEVCLEFSGGVTGTVRISTANGCRADIVSETGLFPSDMSLINEIIKLLRDNNRYMPNPAFGPKEKNRTQS